MTFVQGEKFQRKRDQVFAVQFASNNEVSDENLNDLCSFVNQGKGKDAPQHAWHDGTNLFIQGSLDQQIANVGDWIVREEDGGYKVIEEILFTKIYENA